MLLKPMSTKQPSLNDPPFRSLCLAKLPSYLLATFVVITTSAIFIPLNPDMPDKGIDQSWISAINIARSNSGSVALLARIDQSWVLAINEAVARHLRFGKDIIFTFGPYGSIYTQSFHPATDRLMLFGSTLLALSYAIALLYLTRGRPLYILLIFMLFLATFPSRDTLLLSYPFILVVCALKFAHSDDFKEDATLSWRQLLALVVIFSALGLLPLIKGSLLFPLAASLTILYSFLLYCFPFRQAIPLLVIPVSATIAFWMIAGQSVFDLPAFLHGTLLLTSGYTDAMSSPWVAWPIMIGFGFVVAYVTMSALVYFSLIRSKRLTVWSKWLLGLLCAAFLLVGFKHGFVRTDHVSIAFNFLVIIILAIGFLYTDRYLLGSLLVAIALVVGISFRQEPMLSREVRETFGIGTATGGKRRREILAFISKRALGTFSRITYQSTCNTYTSAWEGIRLRLAESGSLQNRFQRAMANIRSEYTVPVLNGTTDIYTYEQSVLLASNDAWSPRPVFQSYSAYAPALAKLNEQHLRSTNAPYWILLDLMAIDDRLPLLEDGMSWPALLDNYTFISFDGQFVLMRRKQVVQAKSDFELIDEGTYRTSGTVALPETHAPLFAEVDLKPTLLGQLWMALFKPPQLNIVLNLGNGVTKSYRVISNMMTTGFIVSPLVSNTAEFASLATGNRRFQDEGKVKSMSISPSYGGSILWSGTYTLTVKRYEGQPAPNLTSAAHIP
jgi:hypothetical protein